MFIYLYLVLLSIYLRSVNNICTKNEKEIRKKIIFEKDTNGKNQ